LIAKKGGFVAEYQPCPSYGVDVITTAPLRIALGVGSAAQSGPFGVFWDRNGGQYTAEGCPPQKRQK
jgi:hypothetical protein